MKKLNIIYYDAFLHMSCLRCFKEEMQFQIIDEAEARVGSIFNKYKMFYLTTTLIGLLVATGIYQLSGSLEWPSLWLAFWSANVMVFLSASRRFEHLSPVIEEIVSKQLSN